MSDKDPGDRTQISGAGDRTIIVPQPGSRPLGRAAGTAAGSPQPAAATPPTAAGNVGDIPLRNGLNPLLNVAAEQISLLAELRRTARMDNVVEFRQNLIAGLRRFDAEARQKNLASEVVISARYVLCAALDEAILNTPWGEQSGWARASLLSVFHNETFGGEKVFQILERVQQQPGTYLDLLEFIQICLSLGFAGKYKLDPRGAEQLERLRDNLFRIISQQRGESARELSPRWQGSTSGQARLDRRIPFWVIGSVALALLLLVYTGFRGWLSVATEPVVTQLHQIEQSTPGPGKPSN
ncbi:type IVB secretion system protein IcmH/DotU [Mangrovitalea sediminis]|uniref:type IVB secretion system protein IcmH/DotU n=1 Tax=Mangrovitalea sediminis TaxID=1982043 RepID=UPI000BE5F8F9|nr:type IVB secretion system protein IcmH/DotU [Mangrovitalea sediminis]